MPSDPPEGPGAGRDVPDLGALLARMAGGDEAALDRLVAGEGRRLGGWLRRALLDPAEAEDVLQEVLWRAWRNAGRFDPAKGTAPGWLWRIAVNAARDANRRRRFRAWVGLDLMPDPPDPSPTTEATVEGRARLARAAVALRALPERQRDALMLRAVGGLDVPAIAAALAVSVGAAEQLLVRGRASLRRRLPEEDLA